MSYPRRLDSSIFYSLSSVCQDSHIFIHSFIYLYSIDHTDVEFVSKYKYKYKQFALNIGIGRHQLYTNAISDKDIHVIMEHKFSTFPFISSTYKG